MVIRVEYGDVDEGRQKILDIVTNNKKNSIFKVIDIGSNSSSWSSSITDVFVDINSSVNTKNVLNLDICEVNSWLVILDYVREHGKFDYCICTHTLEDIYNPYIVLEYLPKIAKSGIITTPSINTELNYIESKYWSGFIHHRYLFGYKENKILVAPKLPIIEKLTNKKKLNYNEEIRFWWDGSIPYEKFMDNYLGPDVETVIKHYEDFIKDQA